ncbi:MAG: nicotinate-nucleotide--dimethylbenzimidazole phosphoribosyltransferase [Lachnospiraceae bacterium]|nr:nicotinate-nucleotide--dimethylbenzimidazole phosphoribosyltransferase [Lachnospiraceae bacterium]
MTTEELREKLHSIKPYDRALYQACKSGWDHIAKPLDGMGKFEELLSRISAIQGKVAADLLRAKLLVCCADNGIVEEGVSQSGQEITAICAESIGGGRSSVAIMAKEAGVEVSAIDVGIHADRKLANVCERKVRPGTRNFAKEPAMTQEEMLSAIETGIQLVSESREQGMTILCIGEMGIGNTTTSSAVTAALLGLPVEAVTGRGAGLDDEKLKHKIQVIREAIEKYGLQDAEKDPLDVLRCVGGLDIACMAGICMGGALYHVPILLDGFISMAAALIACRVQPLIKEYLIPSHCGKEPAMQKIAEELNLSPVIYANMALGEGTGAILMMQLLKTTNAVYEKSVSFEVAGIAQYERYK